MNKIVAVFLGLVVATSSLAATPVEVLRQSLPEGTYSGKTSAGAPCRAVVSHEYFGHKAFEINLFDESKVNGDGTVDEGGLVKFTAVEDSRMFELRTFKSSASEIKARSVRTDDMQGQGKQLMDLKIRLTAKGVRSLAIRNGQPFLGIPVYGDSIECLLF